MTNYIPCVIILLSLQKIRISDMGYPQYATQEYRYGGYIMKKVFCLAFAILLLLSLSVPAFAAELPAEGVTSSVSPRLRETIVAKVETRLWKYKPQINVENVPIAIAQPGSRFNYLGVILCW